jgi:hypothetical protein
LSTAEPSVVDGNKLGQIDFQAPVDTAGTDAILVGASIWAEADATFSSSVNSTELVFATGASETAAEKMRITSDGKVGIGTSAPQSLLDIEQDNDGAATSLVLNNSNTGTSTDETAEIEFQHKSIRAAKIVSHRIDSYSASGQYTAGLKFITTNSNVEYAGLELDHVGNVKIAGKFGRQAATPSASATPNANLQVKGHTLAHFYYGAVPGSGTQEIFRFTMYNTSGSSGSAIVNIAAVNVWVGQSLHNSVAQWITTSNTSGVVTANSLHSYGDGAFIFANAGGNVCVVSLATNTSYTNVAYIAVHIIGHHQFNPTMTIQT